MKDNGDGMGCVSKWYQRQVFCSQHEPPLTLIRPAPTDIRKPRASETATARCASAAPVYRWDCRETS